MTELPPSMNSNRNPADSPLSQSLPLRPVEAAFFSEMGMHTPGTNSDAFYVANYHQMGKPLAIICDGITGLGFEKIFHSGEWLASRVVMALKDHLDLCHKPSLKAVMRALAPVDPFTMTRSASYTVQHMVSDSVEECVQRFLNDKGLTRQTLLSARAAIDNDSTFEQMQPLRSRYVAGNHINEALLEYDAIRAALIAAPERFLEPLTESPEFRLAFSILNTTSSLAEPFASHFNNSLVNFGGTTLVGAVEFEDSYHLFNAGDSRGCIITPQGIITESLTPRHNDDNGGLFSAIGINSSISGIGVELPKLLSSTKIPKSAIPENSYLVLWSDGCYLDVDIDGFVKLISSTTMNRNNIILTMKALRDIVVEKAMKMKSNFLVGDYTGVVVKLT